MIAQLDEGGNITKIDIKLRLSLMKPLHSRRLVDLYSYMTFFAEKKVIDSGWTASGIRDTITLVLDSLPSIELFQNIAPMIAHPNGSPLIPNHAVYDLSPEIK